MSEKSALNLEHGDVLDGRYRILDKIGEGGFGAVYKGEQASSGQAVAIKVLLPERLESSGKATIEIARFSREMKIIGKLKHPNIVRLLDTGKLDDDTGGIYIVLDFIEGDSLADWIEENGPLSLRETKRLMTQVCDALCTAHELGVVHRDLKPQNIMLTDTGGRMNATVLDFGIASVVKDQRDQDFRTLTSQGEFRGTPAYMAPEQFSGDTLTPQSDIYAWGLVFVECLTGKLVIDGDSAFSIMYQQMSEDPVPVPAALLRHPIGAIVQRSLAKMLDERYATTNELLRDLGDCDLNGFELGDAATEAALEPVPQTPPEPEATSGGGSGAVIAVVALLVIGGIVGGFVLLSGGEEAGSASNPATVRAQPSGPADAAVAATTPPADTAEPEIEEPLHSIETVVAPSRLKTLLGLTPEGMKDAGAVYTQHQFDIDPETGILLFQTFDRPELEVTRTEITWGDWSGHPEAAEAALATCELEALTPGQEDFAVSGISPREAQVFCETIGMRLPTHLEWEALARGVEKRDFAVKGEMSDARHEALNTRQPAASLAWSVTPSGVFDLTGGVSEWVRCPKESGAIPGYCGKGFGVRGGSWKTLPYYRNTWAFGFAEDKDLSCMRREDAGFRCVQNTSGE